MNAVVKAEPAAGAVYREVDLPRTAPDEVLLRVRATSICGTDVHIYNWDAWSSRRIGAANLPQILGHEVAGEVVDVGAEVRRIKVGDYVSAETHIPDPGDLQTLLGQMHIGEHMRIVGVDFDGCFAEYFAVPEVVCWVNDQAIPPEFATVQEPLGNATYAVLGEDNDVAGRTMAIVGDGPVALFAVGVARACGVTQIFLFGMSKFAMGLARRMGADHVYDVTEPGADPVAFVREHTGGYGVDIALDMAGNQAALDNAFGVVRKGGRLSAFGLSPEKSVSIDYNEGIVFKGIQVHGINGRRMFDTWYRVRNLLASGRLDISPVITHLMPLEDFEKGFEAMTTVPRECGKIVLFPDPAELEAAKARAEAGDHNR